MSREKIKVLKIDPAKHPKRCYINAAMKAFRDAVNADDIEHGGIEAKKLERNIYAVFNMDRFLTDLEPNRQIGDDIISGTILIVATNDNRMPVSLTEGQLSKYALRFWNVETFDDMDFIESNMNKLFARFLKGE